MSVNLTVSGDENGVIPLKVVMLGGIAIGAKTSLVWRYARGEFPERAEPTIGAAFVVKRATVDGIEFKLELWGLFFTIFVHCILLSLFKLFQLHRHSWTNTIQVIGTNVLSWGSDSDCWF